MKCYLVSHETKYVYQDIVEKSYHLIHLSPRNLTTQKISCALLKITPSQTYQKKHLDLFKNKEEYVQVLTPYSSINFISNFKCKISSPLYPNADKTPKLADYYKLLQSDPNFTKIDELMLFNSRYIPTSNFIKNYAQKSFKKNYSILSICEDLMHRIFNDFTYSSGKTNINTSLDQIMENKCGVCQDFAHIAICCLRSFGIPARYVSGYIKTGNSSTNFIGGDASHAWFSVYVPYFGWIDLDPTNNTYIQSEHITLSYGRDYDDISPIKGVTFGGGNSQMFVNVTVKETNNN
ncbi:MAG: transglutaminase family protein [Alphaproteobacteria bacterium]|nr:transglutaminase family protein [Alphaproteobacteria bacterium]